LRKIPSLEEALARDIDWRQARQEKMEILLLSNLFAQVRELFW